MQLQCPCCGEQFPIEAGFADADGKKLAAMLAGLDPKLGRAVLNYLRLFSPAKRGLRRAIIAGRARKAFWVFAHLRFEALEIIHLALDAIKGDNRLPTLFQRGLFRRCPLLSIIIITVALSTLPSLAGGVLRLLEHADAMRYVLDALRLHITFHAPSSFSRIALSHRSPRCLAGRVLTIAGCA